MRKTRFGIFMPPWNSPPTQNITASLQRNIETIQCVDALGYEEAWVGEHHSAQCGAFGARHHRLQDTGCLLPGAGGLYSV